MTAKEEAASIVYRYIRLPYITNGDDAKECALIAATMALEEGKLFDAYYIGETSCLLDLREDYWLQVIEEIKTL
jgi:hypothetical protein